MQVSSRLGTAVMQAGPRLAQPQMTSITGGAHRTPTRPRQQGSGSGSDPQQQQQGQGGLNPKPDPRIAERKTRRGTHHRKLRPAAAWQELGRASFTLAALSASGLVSEHLPVVHADVPAAVTALCSQLHAAAKNRTSPAAHARGASSSSSSSSPACRVVSTDPRVLQELEWLHTAAAAGTVEAQMALADRWDLKATAHCY